MKIRKSKALKELEGKLVEMWPIVEGLSARERETLKRQVLTMTATNNWWAAYAARPLFLSIIEAIEGVKRK